MTDGGRVRARNLRTVTALAALYVLPLALAFYLYYGTGWRPLGHINRGTLIEPPRPLPAVAMPSGGGEALRGTWTLVSIGDGACDADCTRALLVMRQVHLALNRDMTRVARMYIATAHCCSGELTAPGSAGTVLLDASSPAAFTQLLARFPTGDREHSVFVVDPLGNLMMSYDARRDPHGLLEDLKKLLRLSHVG